MKLCYVILYVPDVAAAVAFYAQAFGLTPGFPYRRARPDSEPGAFEVAFTTGDVQATHERALTAGAVDRAAPEQKPWGQWISCVADLNGNTVELCTPMGA